MQEMKAESIFNDVKSLPKKERSRLFVMLKEEWPEETDWIHEWKGLSEHFGGVSVSTLKRCHKAGIIKKYQIGRASCRERV